MSRKRADAVAQQATAHAVYSMNQVIVSTLYNPNFHDLAGVSAVVNNSANAPGPVHQTLYAAVMRLAMPRMSMDSHSNTSLLQIPAFDKLHQNP